MRKIIMMLMLCVATISAKADDNKNHIGIGFGLLYENGLDATLSYEHETKYHNAWEYFGNVYLKWDECNDCGHICPESFWNNYNTWTLGVAYKPAIHVGRNNVGRLRLGAQGGSDRHEFIGGVTAGYEHSYQLKHGLQLFWNVKTDLTINAKDLFRTGIGFGIKL